MRYRCLVLDHDDTVVNSTPEIHYPAYLEIMQAMRPKDEVLSLEEFFEACSSPGMTATYRGRYRFTDDEVAVEYAMWRAYTAARVPSVFEGFEGMLARLKESGCYLAVVSHSPEEAILRDYRENGLPLPDVVFGSDESIEHSKPNPWPLQELMRQTGFAPAELLVVDDLRPGYEMARACGAAIAYAGWGVPVPVVRAFMAKHCEYAFSSVAELESLLFAEA